MINILSRDSSGKSPPLEGWLPERQRSRRQPGWVFPSNAQPHSSSFGATRPLALRDRWRLPLPRGNIFIERGAATRHEKLLWKTIERVLGESGSRHRLSL